MKRVSFKTILKQSSESKTILIYHKQQQQQEQQQQNQAERNGKDEDGHDCLDSFMHSAELHEDAF